MVWSSGMCQRRLLQPPLRRRLPVGAQIHPGGNHLDGGADVVVPQQQLHLPAGGHDAGGVAADPPGEGGHHIPPHPHAGGEIVGVILIDRVVGVNNRDAQPVGQGVGHPEGAELALGMDHVGPPGHQLPHHAVLLADPQAGAWVNFSGADGTHVVDGAVLIAVQAVGQGHHPHLVAKPLQLPLEEQHGGHHAVDDRRVPVRCNQNFHMFHSIETAVLQN